jgi:hypothetical protein
LAPSNNFGRHLGRVELSEPVVGQVREQLAVAVCSRTLDPFLAFTFCWARTEPASI